MHGGEESGTDASMRVLYELADRDDCAARQILDNSIVVLLPIQNPDGRELNTRQNFYGFDMNRDWFARTQPETDGKIELLRELPGPLFVDDHEMGADTFFFPPNADPIYHEITDESVDWINNIYGASLAAEFNRQGIPFFNRDVYDLFYMGYGDTVPATGFISAGMTYEKNNGDPIEQRAYEQYVAQWVTLSQGAIRKREILEEWASAWREAYRQGQAGVLEPNEIVNPGNEVVTEVPDRPGAPLLHHRAPRLEAARGAGADPAPPAHGRGGRPPDEGHCTCATSRPTGATHARPVAGPRHLVGADGPDAEALGAGDAERGHLHAVPLLLRRDGVEPAAALQRARRLLRRAAAARAPTACASSRDPGCGSGSGTTLRAWRRGSCSTTRHVGDRVGRLAALPVRARLAAAVRQRHDGRGEGRRARAATTPSWCRTPSAKPGLAQGDAGQTVTDLGTDGAAAVRAWVEDGGHLIGWREGTRLGALARREHGAR